ncbi:MAG: methyltransferase domain-containing protein [Planctomycetes bacterium]|nr:methyltransferase domain-containing protein [Planctomycetota bacterium]
MSAPNAPSPERVLQLITGGWAAAALGSAARHGVFAALESGGDAAEGVAQKTGISVRGAQAVLDAMTGFGLIRLAGGKYTNTPEASAFLVPGKPSYLGAMAEVMTDGLAEWAKLPAAVKTGAPTTANTTDMADNPFWHALVPAIAALSYPIAQAASERLGIAKAGPVSWLDVGGGSGVWSAVWLDANRQARGVQIDWPGVNRIARGFVGGFGVADRFSAIDGDFHLTDFGSSKYDFAIYAHIAHQEAPSDNVALFRKVRRALKPGGTLVVNDFILDDDRTGHPFAMLFASQMVLATRNGLTWRKADYRGWLAEAGFTSIDLVPTPSPSTLVFAS